MTELRKYINAGKGRALELAKALDVTPGAITQWADKQVPAERIFYVSKITGIPVEALRPDIMPNDEDIA